MLIQAPYLAFPDFTNTVAPFLLQTGASAVGLGAVLEQGGRVIAYASRTLNRAEQQYRRNVWHQQYGLFSSITARGHAHSLFRSFVALLARPGSLLACYINY